MGDCDWGGLILGAVRKEVIETISRQGICKIVMFPWDVSARECELKGALNESEALHEVHHHWVSALVSLNNVDCSHVVTSLHAIV